jgi:hypothetical protein
MTGSVVIHNRIQYSRPHDKANQVETQNQRNKNRKLTGISQDMNYLIIKTKAGYTLLGIFQASNPGTHNFPHPKPKA